MVILLVNDGLTFQRQALILKSVRDDCADWLLLPSFLIGPFASICECVLFVGKPTFLLTFH